MTSEECFENKRLYIKYLGKYVSAEILLTRASTVKTVLRGHLWDKEKCFFTTSDLLKKA
jgi:hypothetical protein